MLAKLFMDTTSINGACGDEEELREKFYSELYKATAIATDGETTFVDTPEFVAIITVLQLPPKESFNNVVINEFLYGICYLFAPFILSFNAIMTYSK